MHARLLSTLILATCAAGAQAEDWHFSYRGFFWQEGKVFQPDFAVNGSFSGSDKDRNGIITLDELTALEIDGTQYLTGCLSLTDYYNRCAIDQFSYKLTGKLDINAHSWGTDDPFFGWGAGLQSGVGAYAYSYGQFDFHENNWLWTNQTSFDITPAPAVPEPVTGAMLLAGLLALAARHKDARKGGQEGRTRRKHTFA